MKSFFCIALMAGLMMGIAAAHAQVPGYLGKRFTLFIDANPVPAFTVQNINNTVIKPSDQLGRSEKTNTFAMNVRPEVTLEWLFHTRFAVGVSYSQIMCGTVRATSVDEDDEFVTNDDVLRGQSVGIHLKVYDTKVSAPIPPLGSYHIFSIYMTRTNTYEDKKSKSALFQNDFSYPVFMYGWGKQCMVVKNLILKFGAEFGVAIVPINFHDQTEGSWDLQEYAGYNVHQSLAGYYAFNFTLGLGYVLF